MKFKYVALLFVVCLIPFMGYFLNPNLAFNDSYAFLSSVCGVEDVGGDLGSFVFKDFLLPLFPCNVLFIKFVLFLTYFSCILLIGLFAENIVGSGKGWKVAFVSATLSPLLFFEAMKFENDIFGWLFCLLGLWCISFLANGKVYSLSSKVLYTLVACVCLFFASLLYLPSVLIAVVYCFLVWWVVPIVIIPIMYVLNDAFVYLFLTNRGVSEEMIGYGLPWIVFLFPFIMDVPKKLRIPTIILLIIGFFKTKFMFFVVPFLSFGVVEFYEKYKTERWCPNLFFVGFCFLFAYSFLAFTTSPTQSEMNQVSSSIVLANDLNVPLYNDWDLGWWVTFKGYPTIYKACFPDPDWNKLETPYVALTRIDLNCEQVLLQDNKLKVFRCD